MFLLITSMICLCFQVLLQIKLWQGITNTYLTLSWPDFLTDMRDCAENVFIKLTILVTPIRLYTKMFPIS